MERVERWRQEFPLRPGPLTEAEVKEAMQVRAEWILSHPLHNAISEWTPEEREHFDAVGKLIEESYDDGMTL